MNEIRLYGLNKKIQLFYRIALFVQDLEWLIIKEKIF